VRLEGLGEHVTPFTEADRVTLPVKPFHGVTVTVEVPVSPLRRFMLVGLAESV